MINMLVLDDDNQPQTEAKGLISIPNCIIPIPHVEKVLIHHKSSSAMPLSRQYFIIPASPVSNIRIALLPAE